MVIGLIGLLTVTSIPTVTGVGQAISAQKRQNAESKEQEKFNLTATLCRDEDVGWEEATCYLNDGKLILGFPEEAVAGHKFCGFHFKYPGEEGHLGLVSSIMDDPPMLNWIYVNRETGALAHGARKDTIGHVIGPWGWSEDERFLILHGSPAGFVARREAGADGGERWVLYWDQEGEDVDEEDDDFVPCSLNRKPLLGVDSSYVKD